MSFLWVSYVWKYECLVRGNIRCIRLKANQVSAGSVVIHNLSHGLALEMLNSKFCPICPGYCSQAFAPSQKILRRPQSDDCSRVSDTIATTIFSCSF